MTDDKSDNTNDGWPTSGVWQVSPDDAAVERLKARWLEDPCWDIEDTEGFEAHREELLAFRRETERAWDMQHRPGAPEHEVIGAEQREHTWDEFRETGMLWLVNRFLHLFGWAIVARTDDATGKVVGVYPCRCVWRGFSPESDDRGHKRVSEWMAKAGAALRRECDRDDEGSDA